MKKYVLTVFSAVVLMGCGKDNPISEKMDKLKETKDQMSSVSKAAREISSMTDEVQRLKDVEPLTNEELKVWLPDKVAGMSRKSFKAGETSYLKVSSISASYSNEDKSKTFSMTIYDGAGEMGSMMTTGFRMMIAQDFEEESENGFKRTTKKNGMKVVEAQDRENSEIQLIQSERFFLEAKGENMTVDELWKAVDDLKLNKLG